MMKMVVKTSSNETYEKDIISVNFFKGNLVVVDSEGKTQTYTAESLEYGGDGVGMVTII